MIILLIDAQHNLIETNCLSLVGRFATFYHFTVSINFSLYIFLSLLVSCIRLSRKPSDCQRKSKRSTGLCLPSQVGSHSRRRKPSSPTERPHCLVLFLSHLILSSLFIVPGDGVRDFFFRVASLTFEANVLSELENSSRHHGSIISESECH